MIVKRLMACAFACMMALSLAGCAGEANDEASAESEQQSVEEGGIPTSFDDVTREEMSNAYYYMATQMSTDNPLLVEAYIMPNGESKTVSAMFSTTAEDGQQRAAADEAENLMRLYSQAVAAMALEDAKAAGDEEAINTWQAIVDAETANVESGEGPGGLYEYYMAVVTIQNSENDFLVDGERAAGTDSSWNWQ